MEFQNQSTLSCIAALNTETYPPRSGGSKKTHLQQYLFCEIVFPSTLKCDK